MGSEMCIRDRLERVSFLKSINHSAQLPAKVVVADELEMRFLLCHLQSFDPWELEPDMLCCIQSSCFQYSCYKMWVKWNQL